MSHRLSISRRSILAAGVASAFGTLLPLARHSGAQEPATPAPTSSLGWGDDFGQNNGKLNVATTVAPISSIVRNVGGTRINLRGIIPDGSDSHTFEPAPSDAQILSQADLIIVNGLHLETPTIELAEANLKDGAEIYSLGEQTISEDEYAYDFSFPEEDGNPNPHLWMNVDYALNFAVLASTKLSERDPDNTDYYSHNLDRYSEVLLQLDQAILDAVQTIPEENRKLLTYHDSYAYFAPRYGMTVIGAAQPSDFSEPSPQEVAALIDQIKEEQVPAVFGSEVYPSPVLEQIAEESGATYIADLRDDEPPGDAGSPEHTYIGMMLNNMNLMIPALGGSVEAFDDIEPYDTYLP